MVSGQRYARSFVTSSAAGRPSKPRNSRGAPPWRPSSAPTMCARQTSSHTASRPSRAPRRLTTDEGVIAPNALLVQALVAQLRVTLQAIADFDNAIAQRAQSHPDFPLFQTPSQGPGPSSPPASSSPSANNGNAMPPPPNCKNMRASRRSPNAAARSPGCTGASSVQSSSAKRSWSGRRNRSGIPSGRRSITSSNATRAKRIRPPCAPWHSNGSVSSIGVGRSAPRTMSPSISRRSTAVAHR